MSTNNNTTSADLKLFSPKPTLEKKSDVLGKTLATMSSTEEVSSDSDQDTGPRMSPDLTKGDRKRLTVEPLLKENPNRYVLFPIEYQEVWRHYKRAKSCFWTAEEIDFSGDMSDWEKLSDQEKYFIKNILAFFAGSDGIVMENLATRFMSEIQIPEVGAFYAYQIFNETIHSETYSLLIDTYVKDTQEKGRLFQAIQTIPCVARKAQWAIRWIQDESASFGERLVAFAVVEGVFFSGSFCAIYWLKSRNILPGLTFSNELVSRDEGQHTDFAVLLHSMLINKPTEARVHTIVREAVAIEKEFITQSLPCSLIGMNADLMSEYIEFVADRLLSQLGYTKLWNAKQPFDFMELISLRPKTNFFEKRVGEYTKAGIGKDTEENSFALTEDF